MSHRKLHTKKKTEFNLIIWHGTLGSLEYILLNCTSTQNLQLLLIHYKWQTKVSYPSKQATLASGLVVAGGQKVTR